MYNLHQAALEGDVAGITQMITQSGVNPNTANGVGEHPLHLAVLMGRVEAATELIKLGADASAANGRHLTPLHQATRGGNLKCIELLLAQPTVDVNAEDSDKWTALHYAAYLNRAEAVTLLVQKGAKLSPFNKTLYTPLHIAAFSGRLEAVSTLIEHKAETRFVTPYMCPMALLPLAPLPTVPKGGKNASQAPQLPPAAAQLSHDLSQLLEQGALTDVSVSFGSAMESTTLRAHRAILAARSPILKQRVSPEQPGGVMPASVQLPEVQSGVAKSLLTFLYSGHVPNIEAATFDHLLALLTAGSVLQMTNLQAFCERLAFAAVKSTASQSKAPPMAPGTTLNNPHYYKYNGADVAKIVPLANIIDHLSPDGRTLLSVYYASNLDNILLSPDTNVSSAQVKKVFQYLPLRPVKEELQQGFWAHKNVPPMSEELCGKCLAVLERLSPETGTPIFSEPVNPILFGIPDYWSSITFPMDLGTVKKRVAANYYTCAEEFASDVRRTFDNAMKYNREGSDVYKFAIRLRSLFEADYAAAGLHEVPSAPALVPPSPRVVQMIPELRARGVDLRTRKPPPKRTSKRTPKASPRHLPSAPRRAAATPPPVKQQQQHHQAQQQQQKRPLQRPDTNQRKPKKLKKMTFEEKKALSEKINRLSPEQIEEVIDIIKTLSNQGMDEDDEDIELDLNELSTHTLRAIDRYANACLNAS